MVKPTFRLIMVEANVGTPTSRQGTPADSNIEEQHVL
jgi:hypothetical protein